MTERTALIEHVKDLAVVHGRVTLASGKEADYYVDMRRVTLDGVELEVGGLTLGADPVATAMLHARAAAGGRLDAFVVRKESKSHGLQRRIEGTEVAGRRVLVVEDTSTTGGSALTAVEAVREAGGEVVAVAVVVDRDTGAAERIAEAGLEYRYALGLTDLGL